jgi:Domain of unknown function (DUF4350)
MARSRTGGAARVRGWLPWLAIAAGVVLLALYSGQRQREGLPLDPGSTAPDGTRALVEVLGRLGASVQVSDRPPAAGTATALLLADDLDQARRQALLAWVRGGGTLVVADPTSEVTEVKSVGGIQVGFIEATLQRRCDVPALRDVGSVSAPGSVVFAVPEGATGCFPRNRGAWLLVQPEGSGTVVRLGGASELTNGELDSADNGVLAASLLAPAGGTVVQVLRPLPPGERGERLTDLIAPRVKLFLWQLAVAFAALALWRGRRLGRPVSEPQPVQIPGSELVVAVGNLLQRARGRRQAAALLGDDLRRLLAERLGLPAGAPAELVAGVAAARTGIPVERVRGVLGAASPRDEAELVALARAIDNVRQEVTRAR